MKVAIVTGASSGIGRAAATAIAARETAVIVTYNGNERGARDTVEDIEGHGGTAVAVHLDTGRTETFPAFRDEVAATLGKWRRETFDHLVNNAGSSGSAPFPDTSEELFDTLSRVLLKGPYFLTQTLLPLLADNGAIVNVTSNSASFAGLEPGYSAYGSMKGGLVVLTRYLAKELSPRGIRVNSVSPGSTRTRIAGDAFARFPEVIPALAAKTALGRVGEPDDVGRVIASLLGADLAWITAQDIEVSGGYRL